MTLTTTPSRYLAVSNAPMRYDTEGVHINAHGGCVLYHNGTYYWYGEYRNPKKEGTPGTQGVGCYSSTDLYNWKKEGVVLSVVDDPNSDITAGCKIERPKVIYNEKTGKFVMWFHLEFKGRGYGTARAALAVADNPQGPFQLLHSLRPNAGRWPMNFPDSRKTALTSEQMKREIAGNNTWPAIRDGAYTRYNFEDGQMVRDMTLFVDENGKAYLVASAEENYTIHIHELTDDYLDLTGKWIRVEPSGHNEAPALMKRNGKYYMLVSGCTGWEPNDARLLVADSIWGPWKKAAYNPCVGTNPFNNMGPDKTFGGQSTYILSVHGKPNAYIAMFDVWRPKVQLIESGYIWLPIAFENDKMVIRWRSQWDLGVFNN